MHGATLSSALGDTLDTLEKRFASMKPRLRVEEVGTVLSVGQGVARVGGLPGVRSEELLRFAVGTSGYVFDLHRDEVGVVLLGDSETLSAGDTVRRTHSILDVPVGDALLGRVVDPLGNPLDDRGPVASSERLPVERPAPPMLDRSPVSTPVQTGLKVVDALLPIGRGQRELILGDRQTGKTALAVDTILNQRGRDVVCVYCAVGQRRSAVSKLLATLAEHEATAYTVVVVASGDDAPGVQFVAPYAATSIGEWFAERGRHVLIVYDDLTRHARAYRELSLLLRRPPGREAYPGDIFYIHSRLLERATQFRPERGGGSLTALPVLETQAQDLAAFIPTNLISITDGQIVLSTEQTQKGIFPAVLVGKSVSRVGGKAQLPCFRTVTADLRLAYAQFEELELFSRFGARLDAKTSATLERGRRVRKILEQPQFQPMRVAHQVALLFGVTRGHFDSVPLDQIEQVSERIRERVVREQPALCQRMESGERLTEDDLAVLSRLLESDRKES